MRLEGYAAVFNSRSEYMGFFEELAPGVFDESLRSKRNVLARAEHDSRLLLGTSETGTLRLRVDPKGLRYEVDLPETTTGRDVGELVRSGLVAKSSFAFFMEDPEQDEAWSLTADGQLVRIILRCALVDVASVALPAYSATSVSARATAEDGATIGDLMNARTRRDPEMERLRLEHAIDLSVIGGDVPAVAELLPSGARRGGGMESSQIEMAALATNGLRVDRSPTLRRGRLVVGRRLLKEQRECATYGLGRRDMTEDELRCVNAALDDEIGSDRAQLASLR